MFLHLLLLLGGDIEANPGQWKFPCGICSKPLKSNQMGIQCDECEQWFHVRPDCCDLSNEMYEILANSSCSWICPLCGLPNYSDSFFDNSLHSLYSSNSFDPLNDCDVEGSPPQPNRKQTSTKATRHFKRKIDMSGHKLQELKEQDCGHRGCD